MKSDSEENKDDDEEADGEQEDGYDSRKVKASKKSMERKEPAAKRKAIIDRILKIAPVATLSKCSSRVSSSLKGSKDKQSSVENSNSSKNKPITPKLTANSRKVTNERRSPGRVITLYFSPMYANDTLNPTFLYLNYHYSELSNCCDMTKSYLFFYICEYIQQIS